MNINSPNKEDGISHKLYKIIAIIILVPLFLYLVSLLFIALGILLQFLLIFVLFVAFGLCLSIAFRAFFR